MRKERMIKIPWFWDLLIKSYVLGKLFIDFLQFSKIFSLFQPSKLLWITILSLPNFVYYSIFLHKNLNCMYVIIKIYHKNKHNVYNLLPWPNIPTYALLQKRSSRIIAIVYALKSIENHTSFRHRKIREN